MSNTSFLLLVSLSFAVSLPAIAHSPLAAAADSASIAQDRDQDRSVDGDRDRDMDQDRDQRSDQDRLQDRDRDGVQVYGYDLMTPAERIRYHAQMRSLATQQERDRFRKEHHALMQERARQRGVKIPDAPMEPMHQHPQAPRNQPRLQQPTPQESRRRRN